MTWVVIAAALVVLVGLSAFFGAPYIPTLRRDVRRMFDTLAPVSKGDVVLDLGSGDGLVLREAARREARAVGYEIHPLFVALSRLLSIGNRRVHVRWANMWTAPFPDDVTLVYVFSVGRDGKKLVGKMKKEALRLQRPLVLVCYGNPLPECNPVKHFEAYHLYHFQPLHLS